MKRTLRFTDRAASDIESLVEWLTQAGAGHRAEHRLEQILAAILRLPGHPQRHAADNQGLVLRVFGPGRSRG